MILDYNSLLSTLPREKDREKALILKTIFEMPETTVTRKKLIQLLSLRPSTVSRVIAELIDDSILIEDHNKANIGRGRPEFYLEINSNRFWMVSFSIISMNLLGAVINVKGEVVHNSTIKLDSMINSEEMLQIFRDVVDNFRKAMPENTEFLGLGFALPGLIDKKKKIWRMVSRFPQLEMLDFKMIDPGKDRAIIIERNIDSLLKYCLFTRPESTRGTTLLIHWGYGIAISCSMEGHILQSPNGLFGEIGHWDMNISQPEDSTLESIAALSSILKSNKWNDGIDEKAIVDIINDGILPDQELQSVNRKIQGVIKNLYLTFFPDTIYILSPFISVDSAAILETNLKENLPGFVEQSPSIETLNYSENGESIGIANSVYTRAFKKYLTARW